MKLERPQVTVVDCETGEALSRPMTDEELRVWQADRAAVALAEAAPDAPAGPLAEAVAALETLDQAKPATIGDVVAALKALAG